MTKRPMPEPTLDIDNWVVCWNSKRHKSSPGAICVAELGSPVHDPRYSKVAGCCYNGSSELSYADKVAFMYSTMIRCVGDGVHIDDADREFMRIVEYRDFHRKSQDV